MAPFARLGSRTHKNKTGFDLSRIFVGSEGMLGVVTEATLKLLPLPPFRSCLAIGFASMKNATRAIQRIFAAGFLPCALEIADAFTLAAAQRRTKSKRLGGCRAHVIVELDGQEKSVRREIGSLQTVLRRCIIPLRRDWPRRRRMRVHLATAPRILLRPPRHRPDQIERGHRRSSQPVEDLFAFAERLQKKHRLPVACFGHAGDGNIHVNLMVDQSEPGARRRSEAALDDLFRQVLAWKGVITGEHGIGLAKLPWWPQAVSPAVRGLHQKIKRALDPRGILNPGKFLK